MNDEAELIAQIRAEPNDDRLRLVYADWLTERGDPRGELIQLQVAHARVRPGTAQFDRLQRQIDRLLGQHWEAWKPKTPTVDHRLDWIFVRGFAERLHTVPAAMIEGAPALFDAAPLLWALELECHRASRAEAVQFVEALTEVPKFHRLSELTLSNLAEESAITLSGRPLPGLKRLSIEGSPLNLQTFSILGGQYSSLLKLEGLSLSRVQLTRGSLDRLTQVGFRQLRALAIHRERLIDGSLKSLTERLIGLTQLDLSWSILVGAEMEALVQMLEDPRQAGLERVNLSYLNLDGSIVRWFKTLGPKLTELRLAHTKLSTRAIRLLGESERLEQLELLDVTGLDLDDSTRALLIGRLGDRCLLDPKRS